MSSASVQYKRSRFSTRLPADRLYTASHMWLREAEPGLWQIGFTKFATRLLGEPVEFDIEVKQKATVKAGDVIGWIEGFKAVTDLYCPMAGSYSGSNPELDDDIAHIHKFPYGQGWLYAVEGESPDGCVDVDGYVAVLDGSIDKMLGTQK